MGCLKLEILEKQVQKPILKIGYLGEQLSAKKNEKNAYRCIPYGIYAIGDNETGSYTGLLNNRFANSVAGLMYYHLADEGNLGQIGFYDQDPMVLDYDANNQFNTLGLAPSKAHRMTISNCNNQIDELVTVPSGSTIQPFESTVFSSATNPGASCKLKVVNPSSFDNTYSCSITNVPNTVLNPDGVLDIDYAEDIAQDQIVYEEFADGGENMDERELYYWLDHDAGVRATRPILNNFYLAQQTEVLAALYEVDALIAELTDPTMDKSSALYQSTLANAKNVNNSILSDEIFETNERMINGLYLNMLTEGFTGFDQAEVTDILNLAIDCPYLGGYGVYKARTLAMMYAPGMNYDDLWICNNLGVYKNGNQRFQKELQSLEDRVNGAQKISSQYLFKVFPNPTTSFLNIVYEGDEIMSNSMFKLYDLSGKLIMNRKVHTNHTVISLPVLAKGLYMYTISTNEEVQLRDKILIE